MGLSETSNRFQQCSGFDLAAGQIIAISLKAINSKEERRQNCYTRPFQSQFTNSFVADACKAFRADACLLLYLILIPDICLTLVPRPWSGMLLFD